MVSLLIAICLHLLATIVAGGSGGGEEDAYALRTAAAGAPLEGLPRELLLVILLLLVIVNLPLLLLDAQLVMLHVFLWSQGLTTFEYIMRKKRQLEEEEE